MSSRLISLYHASPVFVQNLLATGYGAKERLLRYGGRYRRYFREIEAAQWWTAEQLQAEQDRRLQRLVAFCHEQVPYYRELFDSLGVRPGDIRTASDLRCLPVLEKETVRQAPERFVPRRAPERLVPQTTGGTTGTPLRYYATPSAIQYNYAMYEARFRRWAGVAFGERMASINGRMIVPAGQSRPPFWRYNAAFNQLYMSPYHLSDAHLPAYVEKLADFAPRVIVGYVSTVHAIARFILERGLVGQVRPHAVLVSSETLFGWMRAEIEEAFGCRVFNGYSMGELVAFISECEAGSLHISPEYGVVELVERDGATELLGTGLMNYAMPLLRYRTGDQVAPGDGSPCACGRQLPTVRAIEGRMDDGVVNPEGVRVGPAALSLAFQGVPFLKEAQIHQQSPDRIEVWINTAPEFSAAGRDLLIRELRSRLGGTLAIELVPVDAVPRTSGGKRRLVVSTLGRR
jgi:phenylacetate-CoA ligase